MEHEEEQCSTKRVEALSRSCNSAVTPATSETAQGTYLQTELIVDDLEITDGVDVTLNMDDVIVIKGACIQPIRPHSSAAGMEAYE